MQTLIFKILDEDLHTFINTMEEFDLKYLRRIDRKVRIKICNSLTISLQKFLQTLSEED